MGLPLETLLNRLLRHCRRGGPRPISVFSPRRRERLPSSYLTLATPEFLEHRTVMDIGAGMSYTNAGLGTATAPSGTLGIWIDDYGFDVAAYIRRNADGSITVSNSANFNAASISAVEGQNQYSKWYGVNNIEVYRAMSVTGGPST